MAVKVYRIHPAVGIARVGDSDQYYLAPETDAAVHGNPTGHSQPPATGRLYRDNTAAPGKILRQAARFRIFEFKYADANALTPAAVTEVTSQRWDIRWTVELANKKSFPVGQGRTDINRMFDSAVTGTLGVGATQPVTIDRALNGANTVTLATLRPIDQGRLLIVPGRGATGHVHPTEADARRALGPQSAGWWDDLGDGPVRAEIRPKGTTAEFSPVVGAWIVLAAPAYSGPVRHVITLYDVLFDIYWSGKGLASVTRRGLSTKTFSFRRDVYPPLRRASLSSWVSNNAMVFHGPGRVADFTDKDRLTLLGKTKSTAATEARKRIFERLRSRTTPRPLNAPMGMPPGALPLPTSFQYRAFQAWVDDPTSFALDWNATAPATSALDVPAELTRSHLSTAAGGGFSPGIEVGDVDPDTWTLTNAAGMNHPSWDDAFRVDTTKRSAGDLTRRLTVPWQVDMLAMCLGAITTPRLPNGMEPMWPGARPLEVVTASGMKHWGLEADGNISSDDAVDKWMNFGFLREDKSTAQTRYLDGERIASYNPP
jgi:hypothetical protein